ncbi:MAG: hypothetical protein P8163_16420 [Candidatus Thiodiazotropha sp.]
MDNLFKNPEPGIVSDASLTEAAEVRKIGVELGLPYEKIHRHPVPGPPRGTGRLSAGQLLEKGLFDESAVQGGSECQVPGRT